MNRYFNASQRGWAGLILIGLILFVRFPVKFILSPPYLMDYEIYRIVALRVLQIDPTSLYAPVYSSQALFKYAPLWALFYAPLGWMSGHVGAIVWSIIGVVCFVLTLWISSRLCRYYQLKVSPIIFLLVPLLMARFLIEEFLNGQTNTHLGLLIVSALYGFSIKRRWWGALALALAISLKLPAALLLVYCGFRRDWGVVGRTVVWLVVLNGLGVLVLSPSDPLGLFRAWVAVLQSSGPDRAFEIGSQSFLALLSRFLTNDGYHLNVLSLPRSAIWWIAIVVQTIVVMSLALPSGPWFRSRRLLIDSALIFTMASAFSPTSWLATYTLLAFPLCVALSLITMQPRQIMRDSWSLVLAVLTGVFSWFMQRKAWLLLGIRHIGPESYTYLVAMIAPWMALMLMGFLWRQRQVFCFSDA